MKQQSIFAKLSKPFSAKTRARQLIEMRSYVEARSMSTILQHYVEDATIHGFKDIYKHWLNRPLRIFLIVCQLSCLTAMCYHTFLVINGYTDQPTSIQTTSVNEKLYKYPLITFCPREWLNVTKYDDLKMPKPALLYALSLLRNIKIVDKINVTEAERQLARFMEEHNFTSYFQMLLELGNDYSNDSLACRHCERWPPKKIVTENGICYHIKFKDYVSNILVTHEPRLIYNPIKYEGEKNRSVRIFESFRSNELSENLYIGMHENDFFSSETIFLLLDTTYVLRITPMRHTFLAEAGIPCIKERNRLSKTMCLSYCHEKILADLCSTPYMLGFYDGSKSANPVTDLNEIQLWSSLITEPDRYSEAIENCDTKYRDELLKCDQDCPALCEKMSYSTTVSALNVRHMFEYLNESSLTIVFSYQVRSGIMVAVEIMSYTWYSFLSNVGGVLGLWCGASLISLYQLIAVFGQEFIYLCCRWKVRRAMEQNQDCERGATNGNGKESKSGDQQTNPVPTTSTTNQSTVYSQNGVNGVRNSNFDKGRQSVGGAEQFYATTNEEKPVNNRLFTKVH